jgi:glycosyltransferase involved in cell wall biosynthesis
MMNSCEFRISVIIPAYNNELYIGETLESVLSQTENPFEIIVVDSSNDNTKKVLQSFSKQISYYFQSPQGVSQARNFGVKMAKGNFLAHLDGDDIWMNNKLESQINAFKEDPKLDIVGGMMESFYSPELTGFDRGRIFCPPDPLPGFSASVIVVKKNAFFSVGPYNPDLKVGLDLDWFVRAREIKLRERMIPKVLVKRRLHKTNTDLLNKQYKKERVQVLKSSLDRRRKNSGDRSEK